MTEPIKLTLIDVLLTKLNNVLNPSYTNKFIFSLFTIGVALISKNQIISLLYSVELLTESFYLKVQVTDSNNTYSFFSGLFLILLASYFFYQAHICKYPIIEIKYKNLKAASKRILVLLDENNRVFNESLSGASSSDNAGLSHDLTSREAVKRNILAPNNEKIYTILNNVRELTREEKNIVDRMKSHIEHFRAHVNNEIVDYTEHQFPIEFESLMKSFSKVSRKQARAINEFKEWLKLECNYTEVEEIYIYGSFLFSGKANDIDVIIKTEYNSYQEIVENRSKWNTLRTRIEQEFSLKPHVKIFSNIDAGTYEEFKNRLSFKHKVQ